MYMHIKSITFINTLKIKLFYLSSNDLICMLLNSYHIYFFLFYLYIHPPELQESDRGTNT